MLIGMSSIAPPTFAAPSIEYVATRTLTTAASSYSLGGVPVLGTDQYPTHVIFGIYAVAAAGALTIQAASCGGNFNENITETSGDVGLAALVTMRHPLTSTATISVSFNGGNFSRLAIVVWAASNLSSSTPFISGTDLTASSNVMSVTGLTGSGPMIIAGMCGSNSGSNSHTWSSSSAPMTENIDALFASSRSYSGASAIHAGSLSSDSVSCTYSTATHANDSLVVAAWK